MRTIELYMNVYEDDLLEHDSFLIMFAYTHRDSHNDKI